MTDITGGAAQAAKRSCQCAYSNNKELNARSRQGLRVTHFAIAGAATSHRIQRRPFCRGRAGASLSGFKGSPAN